MLGEPGRAVAKPVGESDLLGDLAEDLGRRRARSVDYKGWGKSEGPRSRLAPMGRVADLQAAITVLGLQAQVDEDRIGI